VGGIVQTSLASVRVVTFFTLILVNFTGTARFVGLQVFLVGWAGLALISVFASQTVESSLTW